MKFLVDECCAVQLVDALRNAGHDVCYVLEDMPGATDAGFEEKLSRETDLINRG